MEVQYRIPLVPQDLRHEETIVQIAETLEHLSKIVDGIMSAIGKRIDDDKERIKNMTTRVESARRKVENLTKTKKATVVFSCTKYPASERHENLRSIFYGFDKIADVTRSGVKIKSAPIKALNQILSEKLQFFHVKITNGNKSNALKEGLGPIPNRIDSVCGFLVFNSSKNPYQKYVHVNPLIISSSKNLEKNQTDGEHMPMDAAPISITSRDALERREGENYFYSPRIGDIPEIDVPIDLPDLPGVADDLRYSSESGPTIAPSMTSTPSIPDLPVIVNSPHTEVPVSQSDTAEDFESMPPPPLPPPLPPPIVEKKELTESKIDIKEPEVYIMKDNHKIKEKQEKTEIISQPPQLEARANLMEEIRKAGGSKKMKLKATSQSDHKSTVTKIVEKGSFMDDLHAKLSLRRKGISGAKSSDAAGNMDAMSRISAMIPPPPVETDISDVNTTDDGEWD